METYHKEDVDLTSNKIITSKNKLLYLWSIRLAEIKVRSGLSRESDLI